MPHLGGVSIVSLLQTQRIEDTVRNSETIQQTNPLLKKYIVSKVTKYTKKIKQKHALTSLQMLNKKHIRKKTTMQFPYPF